MKKIQLGYHQKNRKYKYPKMCALVDDNDFEALNKYKWYVKGLGGYLYALRLAVQEDGKEVSILLHRQIMGTPKGMHTDHINHDTLDNRRSNLRVCSAKENLMNRKISKNNKSGYKGVSWNKKQKKFCANIKHNEKQIFLGFFNNPMEAAEAYNEAARKYFSQFAFLNKKL